MGEVARLRADRAPDKRADRAPDKPQPGKYLRANGVRARLAQAELWKPALVVRDYPLVAKHRRRSRAVFMLVSRLAAEPNAPPERGMAGKRQISDAEKQEVLERQGLRCFIDNHPVADAADLEYDHVEPYAEGGPSTTSNIAAVCRKHNREKGTLSLSEYRDRLDLRAFFEGATKRRLDDLFVARLGKGGFGQTISTELEDNAVKLYFDGGAPETVPLYKCLRRASGTSTH